MSNNGSAFRFTLPQSTYGVASKTAWLACLLAAIGCAELQNDAQAPNEQSTQPLQSASTFPEAPIPPKAGGNPLAGVKFWVNPHSQAAEQVTALKETDPQSATVISKLAAQPTAVWLGEWSGDVKSYVRRIITAAAGEMPLFVVYNLPYRDCGNFSKGGLTKADAYRQWIRDVQAGMSDSPATVIVEPDALGLLDNCLNAEQQAERLTLMSDAVRVLRQNPKAAVYIDAGHAHWVVAPTMAKRLNQAGIEHANGFALNTSNYVTTAENNTYGDQLSALVGGAHYVIDTSRNGNGSAPKDEWCNPSGRKIGAAPTSTTGNALVDAWLWVKPPGESDGECNGGPKAGQFSVAQAVQLAQ